MRRNCITVKINPPVFIGRDADNKNTKVEVWCFYAVKDGVGRFIKYYNYPFWATAEMMPSRYLLKPFPPDDVIENVELLINDKATFHELPRKQGRRNRIVRTLIGQPDGGDNTLPAGGAGSSGGAVSPGSDVPSIGKPEGDGRIKRRRRRGVPLGGVPSGDGAGVQAPIPIVETDKQHTERIRKTLQRPRRKRKTYEQVHGIHGTVQTVDSGTGEVLSTRGPTLEEQIEAGVVKALPTPEPKGVETVVKKQRGRPRKEKT